MDPRAIKASLREAIRDRLAQISDKDRLAESRSICRRVLETLPVHPLTIAAYYPLKDEADVRSLLIELPKRGHAVYLPRVENQKIVFRKFSDLDHLAPGSFGIPEPSEDSPLLDPASLSIALIPGRVFDRSGNRLGRGNGGYDIWIRAQREQNPRTKYWGIALECQMVTEVPAEKHDERVDAIVTARGFDEI